MVKVKLLSWNAGYALIMVAIKTSAGKLREKGLDYYMNKYPFEKKNEMMNWVLKASKHFPSVLEHVVLTFLIEDVSRILTHQLVRHRLASYTQESQRYSLAISTKDDLNTTLMKYEDILEELKKKTITINQASELLEKHIVIPKTIKKNKNILTIFVMDTLKLIIDYLNLVKNGVPGEDARFLLPQSMKTRILMTVNLREFLHITRLRSSLKAQWEIRELSEKMLRETESVFPNITQLLNSNIE